VFDVFTRPQAAITRTFLDRETGRALPPALAARLKPEGAGETTVLRITFRGPRATDPVLAHLARDAGIEACILSGTVDEIAGRPFGTLVVGVPASANIAARALAFLHKRGLDAEVLGSLPAAWPQDIPHVA
jgi:D-methionine transport system ATP-binding protein